MLLLASRINKENPLIVSCTSIPLLKSSSTVVVASKEKATQNIHAIVNIEIDHTIQTRTGGREEEE